MTAAHSRGAEAFFGFRAPVLFLPLRGTLERRFCGFEYKVSPLPFLRPESRRNTGFFRP